MNNTHCRNWPGDVHVGDEQLCIIHSYADWSVLLGGGHSLTLVTQWIKTVSVLLCLGVDPVVLGCSSGCWDFLIVPRAWDS